MNSFCILAIALLLNLGEVSTSLSPTTNSFASGTYPYKISANEEKQLVVVANQNSNFRVVDMSNPASPVIKNGGNPVSTGDTVYRARMFGNLIISVNTNNFQIFNANNLNSITLISTKGYTGGRDGCIVGESAYVAGRSGLKRYNISDPTNPVEEQTIMSYMNEAKIHKHPFKNVLIVGTDSGFAIVTLERNGTMSLTYEYSEGFMSSFRGSLSSVAFGTQFAVWASGRMKIFDISCKNLNKPKLVGEFSKSAVVYDVASKTIFNRTFVAFSSVFENKVYILDTTDPKNIEEVAAVSVGGQPQGVEFYGSQYVLSGDSASGTVTVVSGATEFTDVDNNPTYQDDCPHITAKTGFQGKVAACVYPPKTGATSCFSISSLFNIPEGSDPLTSMKCEVLECDDILRNGCKKVKTACEFKQATQRVCIDRVTCTSRSIKQKCVKFYDIYYPDIDKPASVVIPNSRNVITTDTCIGM